MQSPWYLWSAKGENFWSSDRWNLLCAHTPEQKITSLHCETTRRACGKQFIGMSGSQVLPSIFIAYITNLWHGKLAQPAVLLCWSQLDGAHGVAAMRKVSSGISLRASSPDAGIPHNLGTLSQNEKAGPGGTGWRREVRVNCISDTVWAQILTQPRWLSRAGLRGRNRLGLCVWAIYSYLAAWKEHSTDSLGRSPVVGETWQFGSSFSSDK